ESGIMKHYRVDKMLHIAVTKEKREGKDVFETMDLPKYSKGLFGMFGGETTTATLLCENSLAGAIIDRFGKDITLRQVDAHHFETHVQVSASEQFLGWIMALGDGVTITGPDFLVETMKEEIRRLTRQYL
ncbi:MAG: helix-turn-helix transcriptional regulator, partial [Candidatus Heritagella sp.]